MYNYLIWNFHLWNMIYDSSADSVGLKLHYIIFQFQIMVHSLLSNDKNETLRKTSDEWFIIVIFLIYWSIFLRQYKNNFLHLVHFFLLFLNIEIWCILTLMTSKYISKLYILCGTVCADNVLDFICVWILEAKTGCSQPYPFSIFGTEAIHNGHHLSFQLQNCKQKWKF